MVWLLILKLWALLEVFLDKFVYVGVMWNKMGDGQWNFVNYNVNLTPKGDAIMNDIATIVHMMLDFVAQFTTLFPANANIFLNTGNGPYTIG